MLPRSEMMQRYRQFATDKLAILKAGAQRQLYEEWRLANLAANQKQAEDEQSLLDEDLEWDHFVVVEKIDIYDEQELRDQLQQEQNER